MKIFRHPSSKAIDIGVIAVAVVCGLFFVFAHIGSSHDERGESRRGRRALRSGKASPQRNAVEAVRDAMKGGESRLGKWKRPPLDIFANLTGQDRRLAEAVQEALDTEDISKTFAAVNKALKSTNSEVRANAVAALEWFGAAALPELTGAMADPDDDVANAAENAWESTLIGIDDAKQRFDIVAAAMSAILNSDHLTTMVGQLSTAALEMIYDAEDEAKASEMRLDVAQTLYDIIDSGHEQNAEAAKDAYEEITGHEWISVEETEKYLADPENYEPPDDAETP